MENNPRPSLADGLRRAFGWIPGASAVIGKIERVAPVSDRPMVRRGVEIRAIYDRARDRRWMVDLATVWRIGFAPVAPGTMVCLPLLIGAIVLQLLLGGFVTAFLFGILAVLSTIACLVVEKPVERFFGGGDPTAFVLDEVAGYALTVALAPPFLTVAGPIGAFFAFRFFDIFKPGLHAIETSAIPGKIVWDDLGAAVLGAMVLQVLTWGGILLWGALR